ncbi:MAG TPA: hypothetical protein VM389_09405 [Phycisphaerae bacterium]|nr:hypothetical protein [Phycisphaerae bacterium]
MVATRTDDGGFFVAVKKHFAFLESEAGLSLTSVRVIDEDPRDSGFVVTYRKGRDRVDVAWNPFELSLNVRVEAGTEGLSRGERFIPAEPFITFITNGEVAPIVPQVYHKTSSAKIMRAMRLKERLFADGVGGPVEGLACRFRTYYPKIRDATRETIRDFNRWYDQYTGD